ncbi:flagellar basal body P-ring protein FlgI [Aminobacterium sp. MB27-C1]|jgi:flagellar P-ring protein precursor FlgI|uniref:flagellar basal body P-ring protein FlgI n=1 Tax=unclassified Aminobacterium TaxID=2685012 RepID=UPI001BCD8D69|nr:MULTISPECIES: flagellar basal body P-ring protein FlgI [unclassified Aminobacterium]MDD4229446.1 flagellar basal body P-ring protein FlgI [Aminobacterium sp.]MEA4878058.1 flagellar basal body P-ring protein FlgI [Aminobacterium sp.]WMI70600.1 flagellar basal body P-ring protein FlgI [Aminobacterium sp. MB27-C1]
MKDNSKWLKRIFAGILVLVLLLPMGPNTLHAGVHPAVRIKDLADIQGIRSNQLVGVGLVMGLQGTGDKAKMSLQMVRNLMSQFGLTVDEGLVKSKNVASVTVTCELPPFARPGQQIDVTVSTMGDAKSLQGGTLLQVPLKGADGRVYAVAQGPVLVGGFSAEGGAARMSKNVVTVGRVPNGALVERDVPMNFSANGTISLLLKDPDFTTAERVALAINSRFGGIASPIDAGMIQIVIPPQFSSSPSSFIANIERLTVEPDMVARVVVNERTGTVVMGGDVKISTVAVAHGNLTVRVTEKPEVVQPEPFATGRTAVQPRTEIAAEEQAGSLISLGATATVSDLVNSLNSVGATPRDIISILQAVKEAGALHGELVVM